MLAPPAPLRKQGPIDLSVLLASSYGSLLSQGRGEKLGMRREVRDAEPSHRRPNPLALHVEARGEAEEAFEFAAEL